jgi:hypothetical protein
MDSEPVYVTFEFKGDLAAEVDRVKLSVRGLRDDAAKTFQQLLRDSDKAFNGLNQASRALVLQIERQGVELRQVAAAQNALDAEYREGAITLDTYIEAKARLTVQEGALRNEITLAIRTLNEQSQAMQRAAGAATGGTAGFDRLSFSVQQVARELPTATMGAHMFFLAISNNLPILADNIKKARQEYALLIAQGQKATPVWKQILASITSWQTALVVGITLLVAYGEDIVEWARKLIGARKALDDITVMQKAFNKATLEAYGEIGDEMAVINKLRATWNALAGDMNAKQKFIAENRSEFSELGVVVSGVKDAENLLTENTGAFIESLKLRAQAAAATSLATEKYKEQLLREEKSGVAATRPVTRWDNIRNSFSFTMRTDGAAAYRRKEAESLAAEAREAQRAAEAYTDLAIARESAAVKILEGAGIKQKKNTFLDSAGERLREIEEAYKKMQQEELEREIELRREHISLRDDGIEKTVAQIEVEYDARIAKVAKESAGLIKAQNDINRKEWEAAHPTWKEDGLTPPKGITGVKDLGENDRDYLDRLVVVAREKRLKDITEAEKKAAEDLKNIQDEVDSHFLTTLENELLEIDRFYKEKIKAAREAGATEEDISRLNSQEQREELEARSNNEREAALRRIGIEEDMESRLLDARTGSEELYQIKKNAMEQKYIRQRLSVLKKALVAENGQRQQATQAEIARMENALTALQQNAKKLKEELLSGVLSAVSDIADAIGEMDDGLAEAMRTVSAMAGIAQNLIAGNYLGAGVAAISSALSALSRENAQIVAAAKKSEADYWDAVNYRIERQIELLKELGGINGGQAKESIQKEIDMLREEAENFDFMVSEKEYRRLMGLAASGFSTATDDFTKDFLTRYISGWDMVRGGFVRDFEWDNLLSGLTAEEIASLREIPEIWQLLPEDLQNYVIGIGEAIEKQKELNDYTAELNTATTRNAIADNIIEGFKAGRRSAAEFADDFEDMMKDAVLQSIKIKALEGPLKEWYESFAAMASDGLTEEEIAELREMYNNIIAAGGEQLSQMEDVTGLDFTSSSREASRKGLESISQDSADLLNGKFTTMIYYQDKMCTSVMDIRTLISSAIGLMGEIATNTGYCRRLDAIDTNIAYIHKSLDAINRDGLSIKK